MSASQPGNMKGPQVKTPLLLLLLLLATLTGTALCQDEDIELQEDSADDSSHAEATEANSTLPPETSATLGTIDGPIEDDHGSGHGRRFAEIPEATEEPSFTDPTTVTVNGEEGLDLIIILIPAVLVVVIISIIVCGIVISRRWNKKLKNEELQKEDPYLDESCTEKVPMPMFEEDVPSVLELEMEELDQWMKKEG